MTDFLQVNGEPIPKAEAMELIRMLCNDAKEMAGVFHGMNRSEKFRADWPDEYAYADANWRHFMEAARKLYAQELGNPHRTEYDKKRMFLAICLWDQVDKMTPEKFGGIQMEPNTQAFEGDKRENRLTVERFGKHAMSFKDLLMSTTRFH